MNLIHLNEAFQMLKRYVYVKIHDFTKYSGTPEEICQQIIEGCWNGTFFQVSTGHFKAFYMRDFSYCVEALLYLGYKEKVWKTLQYALQTYATNNKLTTTIAHDKPVDIFFYAPDTLPLLLRSLRIAKAFDLVETYKLFIEQEIKKYYIHTIDPETGLVRPKKFSSIKDHAYRYSSCYDNSMAGLLQHEAIALQLIHPLKKFDYKKILIANFWNGSYFNDDMVSKHIAGDANVFPYWCGVIDDTTFLKKSLTALRRVGLDKPLPLRYTKNNPSKKYFPFWLIARNYEGNTIWLHLGLCFIDIVRKIDTPLAKKYLSQYTELIQKYKTFPEVLNPTGEPYATLGYCCDEGMLWCSYYLWLLHAGKRTLLFKI